MKRTLLLMFCALVLTACNSQSSADGAQSDSDSPSQAAQQQESSKGFENQGQQRSYALGMDIGNSLKGMPVDIDLDQLVQGIRDVVNGHKTKLSDKQAQAVMQGVVSDMEAAQQKQQQQLASDNLKKGQQFLARNKKKKGVVTLDDGLQYKIIKKGDGAQPEINDSVTVEYTGKLIDGTVFDSSKKHGNPVTFPVNAVIPGWTEALQLMHVGGEYELFVPPDLAYGKRGAGAQIGPNETLIFDVKLISIDKGDDSGSSSSSSDNQ